MRRQAAGAGKSVGQHGRLDDLAERATKLSHSESTSGEPDMLD